VRGARLHHHQRWDADRLTRWLKDRKGRKLSFDDLFHYQKIVVAFKETMRLMGEIDGLIPSWPID